MSDPTENLLPNILDAENVTTFAVYTKRKIGGLLGLLIRAKALQNTSTNRMATNSLNSGSFASSITKTVFANLILERIIGDPSRM